MAGRLEAAAGIRTGRELPAWRGVRSRGSFQADTSALQTFPIFVRECMKKKNLAAKTPGRHSDFGGSVPQPRAMALAWLGAELQVRSCLSGKARDRHLVGAQTADNWTPFHILSVW